MWLRYIHTNPGIELLLWSGVKFWLSQTPMKIQSPSSISLKITFKYQLNIGRKLLIYGFLSSHIIKCQQEYYSSTSSRKNRNRMGSSSYIQNVKDNPHSLSHRNIILHERKELVNLSGLYKLKNCVKILIIIPLLKKIIIQLKKKNYCGIPITHYF